MPRTERAASEIRKPAQQTRTLHPYEVRQAAISPSVASAMPAAGITAIPAWPLPAEPPRLPPGIEVVPGKGYVQWASASERAGYTNTTLAAHQPDGPAVRLVWSWPFLAANDHRCCVHCRGVWPCAQARWAQAARSADGAGWAL